MAVTWEELGPCSIRVGPVATGVNFAGEFKSVKITHSYEEIGESRTMLDSTVRGAVESRTDGVVGEVENDLTAAGLYQFCYTNDLTEADIIVEQTVSGASWEGRIKVRLPSEIGADEFGAPIVSSIEWAGVGKFTFTAATATP